MLPTIVSEDIVIRKATDADALLFASIENSAGTLFEVRPDLAWIAQAEDRPVELYRELVAQGLSWAAFTRAESCIGFVCCGLDDGELHIWELATRREQQRRGIGRALLETAIRAARRRGIATLTLTTFSHVAWNAPFYARFGFIAVDERDLTARLRAQLDAEAARGLPREYRCAMRLSLR